MTYNHLENCCLVHGCIYGSTECPITTKKEEQTKICGICDFYGFKSLEVFYEYIEIKKNLLTNSNKKVISISEDLLKILIKL